MGVGYWKGLNIFMALDLHWHIAFLSGLIGFSMPLAKSDLTYLTTALQSTGKNLSNFLSVSCQFAIVPLMPLHIRKTLLTTIWVAHGLPINLLSGELPARPENVAGRAQGMGELGKAVGIMVQENQVAPSSPFPSPGLGLELPCLCF